jgi:hypothetical protein
MTFNTSNNNACHNRYHYNSDGYNSYGYNIDGYDSNGYNSDGYNKDGYNKDGYDFFGFGQNGLHHITGTRYNENGDDAIRSLVKFAKSLRDDEVQLSDSTIVKPDNGSDEKRETVDERE